jgi:hypothetical protein
VVVWLGRDEEEEDDGEIIIKEGRGAGLFEGL